MSLRELNAAFTSPEKISLAYFEASLLAEQIVDTYGWPALRKLLVTYGEGKEGEEALKLGLGVDIDTLQASFDTLLKTQVRLHRQGDDAAQGVGSGRGEHRDGGGGESRQLSGADRARTIFVESRTNRRRKSRVGTCGAAGAHCRGSDEPPRADGADCHGEERLRAHHHRAGGGAAHVAHGSGVGASFGEAAAAGAHTRRGEADQGVRADLVARSVRFGESFRAWDVSR